MQTHLDFINFLLLWPDLFFILTVEQQCEDNLAE